MITIKNIENTKKILEQKLKNQKSKIVKDKINSIVISLKENTPVDSGNARDRWIALDNKIVNEVNYISYLNQGSSSQAPAYFVEKTVLTHRDIRPSGIIVKNI